MPVPTAAGPELRDPTVPLIATDTGVSPLRGHLPVLDGVRGLAVLLVMAFHFGRFRAAILPDRAFQMVVESGWAGVDLFFVLSGFLITGILFDAKGRAAYFRNFYTRRALRIFPLYYAYLILFILVLPRAMPGAYDAIVGAQEWFWAYLSNIRVAREGWFSGPSRVGNHFWSLAVEEQFYLVWPAVVFWCGRRRLMQLCAGAFVVALAFRIGLVVFDARPAAGYVLLPARLDALAAGSFLALAAREPGGLERLARRAAVAGPIAALVLAGIFVWRRGLYFTDVATQTAGFSAFAIAFGALVIWLVGRPESRASRALAHPGMRFWGKYSYALYVVHPVAGMLVGARGIVTTRLPTVFGSHIPASLAVIAIKIAASTAIALVSWHVMEKHFIRLKDRFPYGQDRPRAAGPLP